MNTLSWLLYGAYVLPAIVTCMKLIIVGSVVFAVAMAILLPFSFDKDFPKEFATSNTIKDYIRKSLLWAIGLLVLISFVPNRETIYLIAASESVEAVAATDEAQEVLGDLKEILKVQLERMKE